MSSTESRRRGAVKSTAELRKFGFVMAVAFSLLGALLWWRGRSAAPYVLGLAVLFLVPALVRPRVLGPIERVWMAFANVLSTVMTTVILTLTFYLVITPMGVLMRLVGKDLLGLRLDGTGASYWIPTEPDGPGSRPTKPF